MVHAAGIKIFAVYSIQMSSAQSYKRLLYVSIGILILTAISIWMIRTVSITANKRVRFGVMEGYENSNEDDDDNSEQGIPASQIPVGSESLYILKSQIVPPVCPRCPSAVASNAIPPPCPACERCPEPAFDCKKVPNYQAGSGNVPSPVLNDFSTFGM